MYKCNKCGTEYEGNFCPECGEKRQTVCPRCGCKTEAAQKFCVQCGFELGNTQNAPVTTEQSTQNAPVTEQTADKQAETIQQTAGNAQTVTTKTYPTEAPPVPQCNAQAEPVWFNSKKKTGTILMYLPILFIFLYIVLVAVSLFLPAAIYPMYGLAADESLGNMLKIKNNADIGADIADYADGILQIFLFTVVVCAACVIVFFTRKKRCTPLNFKKYALATYFISAAAMALEFAIACVFLAKISALDKELGGISDLHIISAGTGAYCVTLASIILCVFTVADGVICAIVAHQRPEFIDFNPAQPYSVAYKTAYCACIQGGRYEDTAARPAPVPNPDGGLFGKAVSAAALKRVLISSVVVVIIASLIVSIGFAAASPSVSVDIDGGLSDTSFVPFAVIVVAVCAALGAGVYFTRFGYALRQTDGNAKKSAKNNDINKKFVTAQFNYLHIMLIVLFAALLALFILSLTKAADYSAEASSLTLDGETEAAEKVHYISTLFGAMATFYVIMYVYIIIVFALSLFARFRVKKLGAEFYGAADYGNMQSDKSYEQYADEYRAQREQYIKFIEESKIYDISCRAYTDKSNGR